MKSALVFFAAIVGLVSQVSPAHAQMNNKPFSFKGTPDGGVGMSLGGKQAIINHEVFGTSPRNMIRGTDGQLLGLAKGRGDIAIVSNEGNSGFLPDFKGSSFRGSNTDISVGIFNSFFSPHNNDGSSSATPSNIYTGAVISTWTARVASGGDPVSFLPGNTVDTWTAMVEGLR